jgi:hypothetical protein
MAADVIDIRTRDKRVAAVVRAFAQMEAYLEEAADSAVEAKVDVTDFVRLAVSYYRDAERQRGRVWAPRKT